MKTIIASKNDENRTLFKFINKYFINIPKSHIYKLLRNKDIKVNNVRTNDPRYVVKENDVVIIYVKDDLNFKTFSMFKLKLEVIFEDDNILIINKPKNLSVHGDDNSLDNAVKTYLYYKPTDSFAPSHVGRLDKETTGLILYAKNYKTLTELNKIQHNINKIYTFLSAKNYAKKEYEMGVEKAEHLQKMIASEGENNIKTKTILWTEKNNNFAQILTGKKHQIRVLLSHLKDPILGDRKYGGKTRSRLYLHCYKLEFDNIQGFLSYLNKKTIICNPEWWGK